MSYDLDFWRYKPGISLDHLVVYNTLCDGNAVEGLEDLPIAQILERVRDTFSDWQKLDDATFDGGDRGGFQVFTTLQFFRVDCYRMDGEDMSRFIDIAREFKCPLYDPQTGERYD